MKNVILVLILLTTVNFAQAQFPAMGNGKAQQAPNMANVY